jgi:pilus assembly protein FimV
VATPAADEPGFLASLLENPLVLPGAGVLVALLAGLGLYRLRGRGRKQAGETSFLESRLQPASFFGASGGQRIDTREAGGAAPSSTSSSSMSYSLSQLDAIGDVDPVAEADVYLAYGRDLQAEEILKEAMRATPDRMAIRTKLLEVYAKRRDAKGFELLATQVFSLTGGAGEDWARVQEMGLQIDPENALYQPGGRPDLAVDESGRVVEPLNATTRPYTATPSTPQFVPASDATLSGGLDVDLDLDLAGDAPLSPAEVTRPLQTGANIGDAADSLSFDLPDVALPDEAPTRPGALSVEPPSRMADGGLDFDLDQLSTEPQLPAATPATVTDPGLDFGDFGVTDTDAPPSAFDDSDPLARKLELAEEFRQIGDVEGARDLLEEVIAKAEGALKSKAQGMLDGLA